jgi:hypothetical protein
VNVYLVAPIRDLLSEHPRAACLSPEQVAALLWILCYVPDSEAGGPPEPFEVAAALEPLDIEREAA